MKDFIEFLGIGCFSLFCILFIVYGVISLGLTIKGIDDRSNHKNYPNLYERDKCNEPPLNIEKYFPTYRFGCWLGEEQK